MTKLRQGAGLLTVLMLSAISPLQADDWPQWRGPKRDGHSAETGLLREWPKDGPKLLWQNKEVGGGYSTPAIVGDKIYLLGNQGDDHEFVLALSARDGSRIWSSKIGKIGHPNQNPKYPGARSTATVDGDLLFALGSDGDLVCLESATGKERWRKHLQNDFGGKHGEWAYAESPLVDGDAVLCAPGGGEATIIALNKKTGELIWKCGLPEADDAGYASMVPAEFSGVKQYVHFLAKGAVGVDAKTGKALWRYERSAKGSPAVLTTPLVSDGFVYTGAFRAVGALVKPVKKGDAFEVEEIYSAAKLPNGVGGVVKLGNHFYGTAGQSALCVDFKTGTITWEERAPGPAWITADNLLFAHGVDGSVLLVEPSPQTYKVVSNFTPPDRPAGQPNSSAFAHPALANGRLYIREWNLLWCYDVAGAR